MGHRIASQPLTIMPERGFASAKCPKKSWRKRRGKFDTALQFNFPWARLDDLVRALRRMSDRLVRRSFVESKMPTMHWPLQWCALAEETLDDALWDSKTRRAFQGIEFSRESVLVTTTLLSVRQRLRGSDLAFVPFDETCAYFVAPVIPVRGCTIVSAAISSAPGSTKMKGRARGPENLHTVSGVKWKLGMMLLIGGDAHPARSLLPVSMPVNVEDEMWGGAVLYSREESSFRDVGSRGLHKCENARVRRRQVALRPGQCRQLDFVSRMEKRLEGEQPRTVSSGSSYEQLLHMSPRS